MSSTRVGSEPTDSSTTATPMTATPTTAAPTTSRSTWRAVALPSEHGGWGLTAEPILLGLLVAPSVAGMFVGLAGALAFLARTPLKLTLVDLLRHRTMERTRLARRLAAVELLALAIVVGAALVTARGGLWWWPVLVAGPLVGVELWFDMRSRGRRLAPELCGAIGISAIAAMIVLASGGSPAIAVGAWLVLSARAVASIPFVRAQVFRLHGRPRSGPPQPVWDLAALALLAGAVAVEHVLLVGAIAVLVVVAVQEVTALSPPPKATVQGIRQTIMGLCVVLATWVGVLMWG